jgi:hypothetical protein
MAATIYGPSGLILNPSANVPPPDTASIGITTFTIERPGIERRWVSSTADFGVGGRGEAGLTFLRRSGGEGDYGLGGFAKYQLLKENTNRPAVAVGIDLIGGELKTSQAYVVTTKQFRPVALTLGAIYAHDRDGLRRNDADVLAGFDAKIAPRLNLVGEWRSRTEGNRTSSRGLMLAYGLKKYGIAVGFVNNGSSTRHRFFIGVGYNVSTVD